MATPDARCRFAVTARVRQDDAADENGGITQAATAPDDQLDREAVASDRALSRALANHATDSPRASAADCSD